MVALHRPTVADVPAMMSLMSPHIRSERLLPRTPRQVIERLREYWVARRDGEIVGVGSLSLVDFDLAEVGVVAGESARVERELLDHLLSDARALGVPRAFVLTDRPALFEDCGFRPTSLDALPQKRDLQCMHCSRLATCQQVALELYLTHVEAAESK